MRRCPASLVALLVVVLPLALGRPAGASAATPPAPPVDKVLIVSLPAVTWRTVVDERPPVLSGLLERSAVASLSVRTLGPLTTPGEGYATLGAGNRASVNGVTAGLAFPVTGPDVGPLAGPALERTCGCDLSGSAVLHPFAEELRVRNDALLFGARPGALGGALRAQGRTAGVVANADRALPATGEELHREAVLGVMDEQGRVGAGAIGPELLVDDASAPWGVRTDLDATAAAFSSAWAEADVVLLEASDLARVDSFYALAPLSAPAEAARGVALARADELLGMALEEVDLERHLVLVVAPASPQPKRDELTVAAAAGPDFAPGLATSASTRRAGYVTLTDVAPTVLAALGVEVPATMTGATMVAANGAAPGPETLAALVADNEIATFRDASTGPFSVAFIAFQILTYALAAAALTWWPSLRPWVAFMALVTLAQPSLAFLSGLVAYDSLGVVGYVSALFVAGAALAGVVLGVARATASRTGRASPLVAPLLLVGLTLLVLVGDILSGGHLQLNTVFGYSPIVAGRFSGYGNLAFALVSMAAVVVVTGTWGAASLRAGRPSPTLRRSSLVAAAAVFAIVVVADGHPSLGTDVGGVLALVPAAVIVLLMLNNVRVSPRHVIVALVATAGAAAAFAAVDLARPEAARTHVGRFAAQLLEGDANVATILERKVDANLSLLFSSIWALLIPVALVFLTFLVRRRQGILRRLEAHIPGLRACLVGALVLAVLGGALNDSGVAVPAMMLAVLLPFITFLGLQLPSAAPPPVAPSAETSPSHPDRR